MSQSNTDVECLTTEKGAEREKSVVVVEGQGPRDPGIVDFDGPNDPENPLNWSATRKTMSIVIVSLTALLS